MGPLATREAINRLGRSLAGRPGVTVVAVDGHSAAGKSTFARRAGAGLAATVVIGDDFYRVLSDSERAALTPEQGAANYYDWQRMRDEALVPLRAGRSARYRPYDWDRNILAAAALTAEPAPVVIVEGLFVSRPELAEFVDVSVLVVSPPQVRLQRQAARADASDGWLARWDRAERWFFEHVRPPDTFDLVVAGAP